MTRAWSALMVGDLETAMRETPYGEGPNRSLRGLADILRQTHGQDAMQWLDTANVRLDGLTPRQVLAFDDPTSWTRISRMLMPKFEMPDMLPGAMWPSNDR